MKNNRLTRSSEEGENMRITYYLRFLVSAEPAQLVAHEQLGWLRCRVHE